MYNWCASRTWLELFKIFNEGIGSSLRLGLQIFISGFISDYKQSNFIILSLFRFWNMEKLDWGDFADIPYGFSSTLPFKWTLLWCLNIIWWCYIPWVVIFHDSKVIATINWLIVYIVSIRWVFIWFMLEFLCNYFYDWLTLT